MPLFTFFDRFFDVLDTFLPVLMPFMDLAVSFTKRQNPLGACFRTFYEHLPILIYCSSIFSPFLRFSGFLKRNGFDDFPEIPDFPWAEIGGRFPAGNPGRAKISFLMLTDFQCN
jgi:hypothetical protein